MLIAQLGTLASLLVIWSCLEIENSTNFPFRMHNESIVSQVCVEIVALLSLTVHEGQNLMQCIQDLWPESTHSKKSI